MNFKKQVKSIQTAGYNGARTVPIFPNKQKPKIDDGVPIHPTPKPQINPSHNTKGIELLVSQMNQLKIDHAKAMKEKEVEIHFLRCTATDSSLATVDALIAKKELKDWTLFKNLPDWEKMSPEEVEGEIRVIMKEYLFNDYKSIWWERQNLRFKSMPKVQVSSIKIGTPIQFDPTRSN